MPAPAAVRGSGTSECRGWYFRAQGLVLPAGFLGNILVQQRVSKSKAVELKVFEV